MLSVTALYWGASRVVLFAVGLVAATSSSSCTARAGKPSARDLGPMAVIVDDASGAFEASAGQGAVNFDEHCVTFTDERGVRRLLVWRSAEATWDAERRGINFSPTSGRASAVFIADGDVIVVGGESFASDQGTPRDIEWLAFPHPDCSDSRFIVNSVTRN